MKKVLKSAILLSILLTMVFTMTGCGKDKKKEEEPEGEKIIATRTVKDDGQFVSIGGDYEETVEIKFVNGKFYKAVWKFSCSEEQTAKTISSMYQLSKMEYSGMSVKEDGKDVTVTFDEEAFAGVIGKENLTKENVIEYLKYSNYTIK